VIERKQLAKYNIEEEKRDPSQVERAIEVEQQSNERIETSSGDLEVQATSTTSTDNSIPAKKVVEKQLSPWGVLVALAKSKRGGNGFVTTAVFGFVIGGLDPT
jgi:hypothetical protein